MRRKKWFIILKNINTTKKVEIKEMRDIKYKACRKQIAKWQE